MSSRVESAGRARAAAGRAVSRAFSPAAEDRRFRLRGGRALALQDLLGQPQAIVHRRAQRREARCVGGQFAVEILDENFSSRTACERLSTSAWHCSRVAAEMVFSINSPPSPAALRLLPWSQLN